MFSHLLTVYKWTLFEAVKSKRFLIVMAAFGLSIALGLVTSSYFYGLRVTKPGVTATILLQAIYSSGSWLTFAAILGGVVLAVDSVSGERERRTLCLILSQPITRAEFIIGKSLAITTALCLATAIAHVTLILLAISVFQLVPPLDILSSSLYCVIPIILFAATISSLSVLFSTLTKRTVTALMITLAFVIVVGPILSASAPVIAHLVVGPPPQMEMSTLISTNASANQTVIIYPTKPEITKEWEQWYSRYSAIRDAISAASPLFHVERCLQTVVFDSISYSEGEATIDFTTIMDKTSPHLFALIIYAATPLLLAAISFMRQEEVVA